MAKSFQRVAIIGLGLIGGSMAARIRSRYPSIDIFGIDLDGSAIQFALDMGWISGGYTEIEDSPSDIDLAIVCTPISTVREMIDAMSNHCQSSMLITDVASVKQCFSDVRLRSEHCYVGGHPMAGRDVSGIRHASAELLEGCVYVLIPVIHVLYDEFHAWMTGLGVHIIEMAADQHDQLAAMSSHVPYLVASAMVSASSSVESTQLMSSGYRDMTRIAGHDPHWGRDVCMTNTTAVLDGLKKVRDDIDSLIQLLNSNDAIGLTRYLEQAQLFRHQLKSQLD